MRRGRCNGRQLTLGEGAVPTALADILYREEMANWCGGGVGRRREGSGRGGLSGRRDDEMRLRGKRLTRAGAEMAQACSSQ